MFNPIENGTIFDLVMVVFTGITLGAVLCLIYVVIIQELGYDPLESGVLRKIAKDAAQKIKNLFRA